MTRVIVFELADDDAREFSEIVHALNPAEAGVAVVHLAIREAADAVLAAMPHLVERQQP